MAEASDQVAYFLLPLDARYAFQMLHRDIDAQTERDSHVREARSKVEERFRGLPSEQERDEVLAPVLWATAREHLTDRRTVIGIRKWLEDGEGVLQAVEEGLTTDFSQEVLEGVMKETRERAEDDPAFAARLEESRQELQALREEEELVDVSAHALLAMLILILILCIIILAILASL